MWKYLIRLSIHPQATAISFGGVRLEIDANGCVRTPVSDDLAFKMRNAPHVFSYDPSLKSSKKEEKVVSSPKRRTTRKKKED